MNDVMKYMMDLVAIKQKEQRFQMKKILSIVLLFCSSFLSAQTYRIGDLYTASDGSQGIVYYVFPGGTGGWAVALVDAAYCTWGNTNDVTGMPNQNSTYVQNLLADTAGYANTQIIRNFQNNSTAYAAGKVDFANGWVLPSPAQLSMLYGQLPFITNALVDAGGTALATNYDYWCSAEYSASNAWRVYFGTGVFNNTSKNTYSRVRAVRSFTMETESDNVELSYSWSTDETTPEITVNPFHTTRYTVTASTPSGCADTAGQTVIVLNADTVEISKVACTHYEWNEETYTTSGRFSQTFVSAFGCDSVVTLDLTISDQLDVSVVSPVDTLCAGDELQLQAVVANPDAILNIPPIAVGDILCDDGSIVKPSAWPVEGKIARGIVFFVDRTGEHGWAVHLHNQATGVIWGSQIDIPEITNYAYGRWAIEDYDGYSNTQYIRNRGTASTFPAAWAVDFDNGWYLPTIGQLAQMIANLVIIDASLAIVGGAQFPSDGDFWLWSSSEPGVSYAWSINHAGNLRGDIRKNVTDGSNIVRSACDF